MDQILKQKNLVFKLLKSRKIYTLMSFLISHLSFFQTERWGEHKLNLDVIYILKMPSSFRREFRINISNERIF